MRVIGVSLVNPKLQWMSSAYMWILKLCSCATRLTSRTYKLNSSGPKIDPWGTPDETLTSCEEELLTLT